MLVTGAAGGVGSALAERFAAAGSSLVLTGRDSARLDHLTARLSARSLAVGRARALADRKREPSPTCRSPAAGLSAMIGACPVDPWPRTVPRR